MLGRAKSIEKVKTQKRIFSEGNVILAVLKM